MKLTGFLLARIAEDESAVEGIWQGDDPDFVWGPGRIRAECEAKRRIVERLAPIYHERQVAWDLAGDVLSDLALPYADHPDYREEWKP